MLDSIDSECGWGKYLKKSLKVSALIILGRFTPGKNQIQKFKSRKGLLNEKISHFVKIYSYWFQILGSILGPGELLWSLVNNYTLSLFIVHFPECVGDIQTQVVTGTKEIAHKPLNTHAYVLFYWT